MEEIEIVRCGPEDLKQLIVVANTSFLEAFAAQNTDENMAAYLAFRQEKLPQELASPDCRFFFAKVNGQVAGYLQLNSGYAQNEFKHSNAIEIERIYALQEFYGKSVGKALMEKAIEIARTEGCDFIWLGVWTENPRAIRFYQKFGFKITGSHPFQFGDDPQTDYLMKLSLR